MSAGERSPRLFVCESCGNLGLGDGEMTCCSATMTPVESRADRDTAATDAIADPDLETLLQAVFGMSETELEICLCVMESGEVTVQELADAVDYDRSVVTRHLNHLADLDVIEKRRQLLKSGGHVYVYTPVDPEAIRTRFRQLFLAWVASATDSLADLRREKVESIVETGIEEPQWRIFREESE